jgi:hypothetical protein
MPFEEPLTKEQPGSPIRGFRPLFSEPLVIIAIIRLLIGSMDCYFTADYEVTQKWRPD